MNPSGAFIRGSKSCLILNLQMTELSTSLLLLHSSFYVFITSELLENHIQSVYEKLWTFSHKDDVSTLYYKNNNRCRKDTSNIIQQGVKHTKPNLTFIATNCKLQTNRVGLTHFLFTS